jgi:hypothetical protein
MVQPFSTDLPARLSASATTAAAKAAATTAATAAKAAAATTAAEAAPTTGPACFLRTCFIHGQGAAAKLRFVQLGDRLLRAFVRGHFHEAESTRASRCHVAHYCDRFHWTNTFEELLQIRLLRGVGKVPDV